MATTLTTLEEIVHQLWALQPLAESEAKFSPKIHVLNSNLQDSSSESFNTEEHQLQNLKPKTLQAGSPQAQLPGHLHFSGLKSEPNLTLVKLLRPINLELPAPLPLLQKDPVSPANESTGLAKDPKITGAITAGELKKLPVKCGPPKNDQSYNSKREFESSHFNPANERFPM
ncbi:hypothetical protein DSO57_1026593 [Entomophthora muscae]|uniref:Uncharacterized protein n=1 Tax=Entomophthora muscae TaxID=34485 RepID=A0ACC2RT37_9FUNG|nr:hypothetical protein DSO57_1026593 [Entomophthora muscae]